MILLCTICSELLNPSENLYITKCGHLFHYDCLHTWIVRSNTCPQCRNRVTEKYMFRFYPTTSDIASSGSENTAKLQINYDHALLKLNQQATELRVQKEKTEKSDAALAASQETIKSLKQDIISKNSALKILKEQLSYLKSENQQLEKVQGELESHKKSLEVLQGLQKVFNATVEEVENMLQGYPDVRTVATFAIALKKALYESESKMTELRNRLQAVRQELAHEKMKNTDLQTKYVLLENDLSTTTKNYEALKFKCKGKENDKFTTHTPLNTSLSKSDSVDMFDDTLGIFDKTLDIKEECSVNTSLNTMINKIENADSPYLNLKQSNLAWATIQNSNTCKGTLIKNNVKQRVKSSPHSPPPSYFLSAKLHSPNESFLKSDNKKPSTSELNISYDGLGGHASHSEEFPKPKIVNSFKPKLTAKHKLKRPNPAGTQNIAQLLKKLKDH